MTTLTGGQSASASLTVGPLILIGRISCLGTVLFVAEILHLERKHTSAGLAAAVAAVPSVAEYSRKRACHEIDQTFLAMTMSMRYLMMAGTTPVLYVQQFLQISSQESCDLSL